MKKEEVMEIILKRIKFRQLEENKASYDGFDMSGYDNSFYSNLELIARFSDLLNLSCGAENRQSLNHFPIFWKGTGQMIKLDNNGKSEVIEELVGVTTTDILFKILTLQNINLLK